jgi:photosystem II stability/assembly factor-like uncharacterized protein
MRTEKAFIFFCVLFAVAIPGFSQTWMPTMAPTNYWSSIVSSADGNELAASVNKACYTSTNGGTTWISNNFPAAANGSLLAASADGIHLVSATSNSGEIDVSTNGGLNWTKSTNYLEAAWFSIVSSGDGKTLVLTEGGPTVRASTNSGATWFTLAQLPNNGSAGQFAAMSADGSWLGIAVGGYFFTTTNFGKNWVTNNLSTPYRQIAASADGRELVTAPYGGNIYTSTNFGTTWIQRTNSPDLLWWSCASSADGTKLAAVSGTAGGVGVIYTSTDSGMTWASNSVPNQQWIQIASSADGNKLVAIVNGNDPVAAGGIWTLQTTPTPQINLTSSGANLSLSWIIPSSNFVLEESSNLISWEDVTNAPTLNLINLQNQINLSPSNSLGFYRLATP